MKPYHSTCRSEFDDPAFQERLRDGEQEAYRHLVRRSHGLLVSMATSIIGSRAQAEEVVQDTWLAVYSGIGRFEGRSSLITWLISIVVNHARTRISGERRTVGFPVLLDIDQATSGAAGSVPDRRWIAAPRLWDELNPERIVGGRQLWERVRDAIETLPAGQRAVVILRDTEGKGSREICELLSISPENQRVLLHRGRARIREAADALTGRSAVVRPAVRRQSSGRPARGQRPQCPESTQTV